MGMILVMFQLEDLTASCPHTHGDDPGGLSVCKTAPELVPTRMGMILLSHFNAGEKLPCPHTHGDDPIFY